MSDCPECDGEGWVPESAHGCDGIYERCLKTCPVLVQAPCPVCVLTEAPEPLDGEEPF